MAQMNSDEIEELIRQVIAEDRAESIAHPGKREKFTRYTDPEGKTWVSMTLERAEVAQKLIGVFLALCSLLSVLNYAVITYAIRPAVEEDIKAEISEHETRARERMREAFPAVVTRAEFTEWTAEKNEKWKNQDEFNGRVEAALILIQADVKEILKLQRVR